MKRIIIVMCICLAGITEIYAQYPYTLKKCLEEGLANNYSIRITRNEEQVSHNNATLANAVICLHSICRQDTAVHWTTQTAKTAAPEPLPANATSTTKPCKPDWT